MAGDDVQQLVPVVDYAFGIDHQQAIAVAVERYAEIGAFAFDCGL